MSSSEQANKAGWFYRLSTFFRNKFGEPVYKIPLNAGFSCPNRDGTIGSKGCSYCYNPSFSPCHNRETSTSITGQLEQGKKKKNQGLYLAYFQSYTNTYAPLEQLKKVYDEALACPEIIGLSVATRPDCISAEIIDLLESYTRRKHIWIEFGLQSAHDPTLEKISRGHSAAAFTNAVELTRGRGLYICAHIILGLPGETGAMMLETIEFLNRLKVDGIKFHHLQVIKHTRLAVEYEEGTLSVYNKAADYIPILCDCLERLSPAIVVHRLASQVTSEELLIAPHWPESAGQIAAAVEQELKRRRTCQGYLKMH